MLSSFVLVFSIFYLLSSILFFLTSLRATTLVGVESGPPVFLLQTAAGEILRGQWTGLDEHWSVQIQGKRKVPGEEVVSLRRAGAVLPSPSRKEQLFLANGDRLPGELQSLDGEKIRFRAFLGEEQEMVIPLNAVALFWMAAPENQADQARRLQRRLLTEKRNRDAALLRNGDLVQGAVAELNRRFLKIEVEKKETEVELNKLAALAFSSELVRLPRPEKIHARLVLANGCRLTLASAHWDGEILRGRTLFQSEVRIAVDQIVALDIEHGCAVYLSDLKPKQYQFISYLGNMDWPYGLNASVGGGDLRLGGNTFDKGIGLHSKSRLTFDLDGKYRRFEAIVGLDELEGKQGGARIEVLIEGKAVDIGLDKELTHRDGGRSVHADIGTARELTLVVDFGERGDVQGHVDWADARLIK